MEPSPHSPRLARLLGECQASAVPALLLLAACGALLLLAALDALQPEPADTLSDPPASQLSAPSA